MPEIFINFRKPDRSLERDRLYRVLVAAYGPDAIFKSGVSIPVGADYAEILTEQARTCKIMLVLIGPDWLTPDEYGYSPSYWDQREIATALQAGNTVIPVLLGGAVLLPHPDELPEKIAQLGRLQFQRLSEVSFDRDAEGFVSRLAKFLPPSAQAVPTAPEPVGNGSTNTNTITVGGKASRSMIANGDITRTNKVRLGGGGLVAAALTTTAGRVATVAVVLGSGVGIYTAAANGGTADGELFASLQGNWRCHESWSVPTNSAGSAPASLDFTMTIGNGTFAMKGEAGQRAGTTDHGTWRQDGDALTISDTAAPQGVTLYGMPTDYGSFHTAETFHDSAGTERLDLTGSTAKNRITVTVSLPTPDTAAIQDPVFVHFNCARA